MALAPLSGGFQSLPPLLTSKLGPSGADSPVGGFVYILGPCVVSPTNSPVRLGVSPAATSTPSSFFSQRFEALFLCTGALGCVVYFIPQLFTPVVYFILQVYLRPNLGPPALPAAALPLVLSTYLPISIPPTCLNECFSFNTLVVRLPYSSIFWQF